MEKSIHSNEYALFLEMLRATRERVGLSQGDIATKLVRAAAVRRAGAIGVRHAEGPRTMPCA